MVPMRKMVVALAVLAALAAFSTAGYSGKGGGKGNGKDPTASGVGARIDVNQASPHYGDSVTFSTSYPATNETIVVGLKCFQNDVLKFQLVKAPDASFPLAGPDFSTEWTSGAAHCTADLMYYTYKAQILTGAVYLASTSFDVAA